MDLLAVSLVFEDGVLALAVLLLVAALLSLVTERIRMPYELVLVAVGLGAAALGRAFGLEVELTGDRFRDVVVFVFLPTLIFAAARAVPVRLFLRSVGPILLLAVPGYLVSLVLIGAGTHLIVGLAWLPALVFGALISATDTATVMSLFKKLGVPDRVRTLIEGESLLNDGVAITAFAILVSALGTGGLHVGEGVLEFFAVVLGGAGIGMAFGVAWVIVAPRMSSFGVAGVSLAVAYGAFALSEIAGVSGPIATLVAGLTVGMTKHTTTNFETRALEEGQWESFDFIANTLLFLLIGVALELTQIADLGALVFAYVLAMVARAAGVVPFFALGQRLFRMPGVSPALHAVVVWGGLRGGVALALALTLPGGSTLPDRELLIAMTVGVVVLGLVINGTTLGPMVRRLGLAERTPRERFLIAIARVLAARDASAWVSEFGRGDTAPALARIADLTADAETELRRAGLPPAEQAKVLRWRCIEVERVALQKLRDVDLLDPARTWRLLRDAGDRLEALLGDELGVGRQGPVSRALRTALQACALIGLRLHRPPPRELSDARVGLFVCREVNEALDRLDGLAGISRAALEEVRAEYAERERAQREAILRHEDRDHDETAADRALSLLGAARGVARSTGADVADRGLLPETAVLAAIAENDELLGLEPDLSPDRSEATIDRAGDGPS